MNYFFLKSKEVLQNLPHLKNEKIKHSLLQAIPFWGASLITGLVAILYAKAFAMAESVTSSIFNYHWWLLFIISPVCFISSWWLVKKFAPYSKGSGIPQVMAAIDIDTTKRENKVNKLLSFPVIIIKVLSSLIFVIGGGVIGREGPTIQIAGSIFRKINEMLPQWWPKNLRRNMVMTGAAAGLAAAFNAPLGGIMFAIEELAETHISQFKTAVLSGVIIAGLTAQSIEGPYLYLGYPIVRGASNSIIFSILIVAIVAGLMGSVMSKIILKIIIWKSKFKFNWQSVIFLVCASLILALFACFVNVGILGSGKQLLTTSLFTSNKQSVWYMPLLRTIGPILSFTTGASGGIFAPGLSAGGSVGSVISGFMGLSPVDTNVMILAGMVAFLTGITRTPFTSAIIVLEMTDGHSLILQLMTAGIISNLISIVVDKHSLYHYLKIQYLNDLDNEEPVLVRR